MWTIERITERCKDYCGRANVEFNVPVIINGRLKTTLGRCISMKYDNFATPNRMEFSKQFLETATDESIEEVIAHECAHYVTVFLTHEIHNHDAVFKHYCKIIGTTNSTPYTQTLESNTDNDSLYRYTFYCTECKKFVCGRHRKCKMTDTYKNYLSGCCGAPLEIRKNW